MTTFSESEIARDSNGKFAPKTTSETKITGLVSNRRAAKSARHAFAEHDDPDTFPTERLERYLDAYRDDDATAAHDRAVSYVNGYLGKEAAIRNDAYHRGRQDAVDDAYYSPCQVGATNWRADSLEASQRENERQATQYFQRRDLSFDTVESDPEVTDARARFEMARDNHSTLSMLSLNKSESGEHDRRVGASVDEAFARYESRRITKALRA